MWLPPVAVPWEVSQAPERGMAATGAPVGDSVRDRVERDVGRVAVGDGVDPQRHEHAVPERADELCAGEIEPVRGHERAPLDRHVHVTVARQANRGDHERIEVDAVVVEAVEDQRGRRRVARLLCTGVAPVAARAEHEQRRRSHREPFARAHPNSPGGPGWPDLPGPHARRVSGAETVTRHNFGRGVVPLAPAGRRPRSRRCTLRSSGSPAQGSNVTHTRRPRLASWIVGSGICRFGIREVVGSK